MDADFNPDSSRLRAVDSDGKQYLVGRLTVQEALSEVGHITVQLVAKSLKPDTLIGKKLTCSVYDASGSSAKKQREFEGYIEKVSAGIAVEISGMQTYEVTLCPWFWLLSFTRNYRVFQSENTQAIVSSIFEDAGFSGEFKFLAVPGLVRPYCLQYGESDYEFVRRLLAEVGVNFYFEQEISSHKMVMQDAATTSQKLSGSGFVYQTDPEEGKNTIFEWQPEHSFHDASVQLANYDYEQTKYAQTAKQKTADKLANASSLMSASFTEPTVSGKTETLSDALLKRRSEQSGRNYEVIKGESASSILTLNKTFSLLAHFDSAQLGDYLLVAITHDFINEADETFRCSNRFSCIDSARSFYPPLRRKPIPPGITSGVVEGKDSGKPQQDNQARVKVRFHWDSTSGDSPSCWIRVAQAMAGKIRGAQFVPRAGDEVLVGFIDEDIDRPVVMASVYNSVNTAIFPEANSTKTGFSTKLSGKSNELYFDDKSGEELVYMHAAADMTVDVEKDLNETIKGELSQKIEKKAEVNADDTYLLEAQNSLTEKSKEITIEGEEKIVIKVADNSITLDKSGITIKAGTLNTSTTKDTSISAAAGLTCKSSASAEFTGTSGVKIDSPTTVDIQGDSGATIKSSAQTQISGTLTEIKGALVKIN